MRPNTVKEKWARGEVAVGGWLSINSSFSAEVMETPKALENLDEIASVPGFDALYIGPSDLSQALGLGPRYNADNPLHNETVLKIRDAAVRHGKVPGVHTSGSVLTNRYIREGFKMVMLTADTACMTATARSELDAIQESLKAATPA
jgi:4-hydroxy-2-oxoheptanedioate aldolase